MEALFWMPGQPCHRISHRGPLPPSGVSWTGKRGSRRVGWSEKCYMAVLISWGRLRVESGTARSEGRFAFMGAGVREWCGQRNATWLC